MASTVGIWPVMPWIQYFFTMSSICGISLSLGRATAYFMLSAMAASQAMIQLLSLSFMQAVGIGIAAAALVLSGYVAASRRDVEATTEVAALVVLAAGVLFTALGGSYARVGAAASFIYGLGILVIWFAPETNRQSLVK